ncbi:DNA-binding protein [Pseudomonas siliginis]|uniref:DNA-binding protein n=1 Tax=Pseudomonas siliginis TaxID=2842346 RepID=UPI002092E8CA|nr:DNA-binding protein [Pseudomonas siliginis]UST72301.1 DNA-binding protein [Pseudomonas siliginis]
MARPGVNKAVVRQARDALLAREQRPSIEAVRAELGHTGSKSTIQRFLKELAAEEPHPPEVSLSQELLTFINSLAQRLGSEAQQAVAADRARLERQQHAYQHQREVDQARQDELQKNSEHLLCELKALREQNRQLIESLQQSESDRQRLLAHGQYQQQLLEDRATQLQSLEEQSTHAREGLHHFREQTKQQRQEEVSRFETELLQLRQELRAQQEQLLVKQDELSYVYRDLERLSAEHVTRAQELRTRAHELEHQVNRYQLLESRLQTVQADAATLQLQLSVMQEKARHCVLDRRQDLRNLRNMARQLAQLERLLLIQQRGNLNSTR